MTKAYPPPGRSQIIGALGGTLGAVIWIFPLCFMSGDWLTAVVVGIAAYGVFMSGITAHRRQPERLHEIIRIETVVLGSLNIAVILFRWDYWMVHYRQSRFYDSSADLPAPVVALLVASVAGFILWMNWKDSRRTGPPPG
ncbi:MAG: hypothetical protein KIT79_03130 [Deltaproteobacteria bacterium]|nr:hypothetical protein [Deltaproteobacteria bacterium]